MLYMAGYCEKTAQTGQALKHLTQAELAFGAIQGDNDAERMARVCLTDQGDCLLDLGQVARAIVKYQQLIELAKTLNDVRGQAVGQNQLATALRMQQDYPQALAAYEAAKDSFTQLNEPAMVAVACHQMGTVYDEMNAS